MKNRSIAILLMAAIAATSSLALFSCTDGNGANSGSTSGESESIFEESNTGSDVSESNSGEDESESEGNLADSLFGDGEDISEAGIAWDKDAFALFEYTVDESRATEVSASELAEILKSESASKDDVFKVTEPLVLESGFDYGGNFASIIATEGVIIKDCNDIVVRELVIKGDVTIENSNEIVLFNVDIQGGDTALTVDRDSFKISIKSCKISATELCARIDGTTVTVFETELLANKGIVATGDEVAVHGCYFINPKGAFLSEGSSCIIRNSTVECDRESVAIEFKEGSVNGLIALNVIRSAQSSVRLSGGYNCTVIFNSAVSVSCSDTTNLYVVENKLGGILELKNNDYLICENNTFANDGKDHDIVSSDNTNVNGNNLTDVNARADVGANEDILPHTNKELFVGMERRTKVLDASFTKQYGLNQYIRNNSKSSGIVIIPPGAYSASSAISLGSTHSSTVVYAYGVYEEFSKNDSLLTVSGARNIEFHGLTMGYDFLAGGQIDLLAKNKNTFTFVGSAGWENGYGKTDPSKYSTGFTEIYTGDALYPWAAIGNGYSVKDNGDGTWSMTINDTDIASKTYAGDSMTCRYAGENKSTVNVNDSKNIKFKDCVLYGFSNSLAVVARGDVTGMSLERFHNTTQPCPIIDEETYDRYKALEAQYGVKLGVYIDDAGRYRGARPLQGSTDATHIMSTTEGVSVTSSIFEGMTDDGSNQRSSSARLHKIEIDGGIATIYYKGLMAAQYEGKSAGLCTSFKSGDTIKIYSARGEILCETAVLSSSAIVSEMSPLRIEGTSVQTNVYAVTVNASALDKEVLEIINTEYDLNDNSSSLENRVLVDNISHNSAGFTFDNVLIQNTRSRGILVKTHNVTIKSCTFKNLAHTGLVICTEPEWGESTAANNVTVSRCVFDNTGAICDYINRKDLCPIMIGTSGSTVAKTNTLPYKNITIDGCLFKNNKSRYAITVRSAQNVTITNNVFEPIVNESISRMPTTLYVNTSMNVTISDNTYTPSLGNASVTKIFEINKCVGIGGTDVTDKDGVHLFPNQQ